MGTGVIDNRGEIVMTPDIRTLDELLLVGLAQDMSLAEDATPALFQQFFPLSRAIKHRVDDNTYLLRLYNEGYFAEFSPEAIFTKVAAIAVTEHTDLTHGLSAYRLSGLYAVFIHRGLPNDAPKTMQAIFAEWLPSSDYQLDHRPHFDLMPPEYRPDDPSATEEIWIPIK